MNVTELREHLRDQAAEIHRTQPVPVAAVRRRKEQLQRRRIATATAAIAMVGSITAVAIGNNFGTTDDGAPANAPSVQPVAPSDGLPTQYAPTSPSDHVQNGVRFRSVAASDSLETATVGQVGQGSVSLRWAPGDRQVVIRVFCHRPAAAGGQNARVVLRIDGRVITTEDCSPFPVTDPGSIPTARLAPKDLFPNPTRPADITAEIVDASGVPSPSPDQQVGFGIYSSSDSRSISGNPLIYAPEVIQHQGVVYRLNDGLMMSGFSPTLTDQGVAGPTPAFKPFIVVFGTVGVPTKHTFEIAGVSGGHTYTVAPGDGPLAGLKAIAVKAQAAGQVEVRPVGPDPTKGDIILAIYVLDE